MNQQEVFAVEEVLPIERDNWLVRGRAYEDLKVGDIIQIHTQERIPADILLLYTSEVTSCLFLRTD